MNTEVVVVGSVNLDLVAGVPRNPNPGETIHGTSFERFLGGKGANQAVAAAQAGAPVFMIGRHGTDEAIAPLLPMLRAKGVDVAGITLIDGSSGIAVILVTPAGQNSIVVVPGANGRLTHADILCHRERLATAGMILTQLETPLEALEGTLTAAGTTPVMLDPAPMQPLPAALLARVAWLTPNESEAAALVGAPVPEAAGLSAFAERLLALGPSNVLLKLGARGAFLATASGLRQSVPAIPVEAVDSTAAGDALNGAFAAALLQGADALEAARFGVAAASLSVTRAGAIPSMPSRADVEAFRLSHL